VKFVSSTTVKDFHGGVQVSWRTGRRLEIEEDLALEDVVLGAARWGVEVKEELLRWVEQERCRTPRRRTGSWKSNGVLYVGCRGQGRRWPLGRGHEEEEEEDGVSGVHCAQGCKVCGKISAE